MIAVLIPAHNEAQLIGKCLTSVAAAAKHEGLAGEEVLTLVAADRCTDSTRDIALAYGAHVVSVPCPGGVGIARDIAAREALSRGARWLAMTDADSVVPSDWLAAQILHGADVFCGIVRIEDWLDYPSQMKRLFNACQSSADGHSRVHGANLGVSADWYVRSGGFPPISTGEDVALVKTLRDLGAHIRYSGKPTVTTSARRIARAQHGFSAYLRSLEASSLSTSGELET